jgi:hypothetical protein
MPNLAHTMAIAACEEVKLKGEYRKLGRAIAKILHG